MNNGAIQRWTGDERFRSLLNIISGRTLIDPERLYMIYQLAGFASKNLPGAVAEVGVYKGGSARIIVDRFLAFPPYHRKILLFDTFEGMPDANPGIDLHKKGDFGDTSAESVRSFLQNLEGVELRVGRFPESLRDGDAGPFAFVHADADIYGSTADIIGFFRPFIVPGGMILFDDYGFPSCPGAKKAVDDLLPATDVVYLPTGQALFIKR